MLSHTSKLLSALACALAACLLPDGRARAQDPAYELEITPSICVSRAGREACSMLLEVNWRGAGAGEVCLLRGGAENPLRCWRGQTSGQARLNHEAEGDMAYKLVSMQNSRVLAEGVVRVISRDLRDSRRRRRHVWSIL